jgi:hypothetical protein
MLENRKSIFFLLKHDKVFEDETTQIIKDLYNWPSKLNNHMDICDDRHRNERNDIEIFVMKKKDTFEKNMVSL